MGQSDIWDLFKEIHPAFIGSKDICRRLNLTKSSVYRTLKRFELDSDIEVRIQWGKFKTSSWERQFRIRPDIIKELKR